MKTNASHCGLDFKIPLKPEYFFDNAVMVALAGHYQKEFCNPQNVLDIQTDEWHYRDYVNRKFGL
jgi:tRNA A37 threonylcarbamoyltransferase TsaD